MTTLKCLLLLLSFFVGLGCVGSSDSARNEESDGQFDEQARELARRLLIVDTHIDVPYRIEKRFEDVSQSTDSGDFDYPRAIAGGLNLSFMSVYIPAEYQETGKERPFADQTIDLIEKIIVESPDKFVLITEPEQANALVNASRVGFALGMENGAPIVDLKALRHYFDRGVRYITLTHSEDNIICDSSYSETRSWNGLSPYGREVVAEMNRLGMMIDLSHVSDAAFAQSLELSTAPVIVSHSSARHFTPGFERNVSDELIRRVGENGGVIQINFGSAFLREDSNRQALTSWAAGKKYKQDEGLESGDPKLLAFQKEYWSTRDRIYADVKDVADHVDHVVELAGIDHVGFGSDFDGVGDSLPTGLKDVSQFPNLIRELLVRGYSEEEIAKIAGGNLMRVWAEVTRVAAQ